MADCGFAVSYYNEAYKEHVSNNCHHTYSELLNVVFARRLCIVPFLFKTKVMPPAGCHIRAMCIMRDNHIPLMRCTKHLSYDSLQDDNIVKASFMRCHNPHAVYQANQDGHISIKLPIGYDINEDSLMSGKKELFEFHCSNHCVSYKQKTPILFVITLEKDDAILCRKDININVCASPGRDMRNWERMVMRSKPSQEAAQTDTPPKNKKRALADTTTIPEVSTTNNLAEQHCKTFDSYFHRVQQGLELLEVIPLEIAAYYKSKRHQSTQESQLYSWPQCPTCYQPLDIEKSVSNQTLERLSTRYCLMRFYKCC